MLAAAAASHSTCKDFCGEGRGKEICQKFYCSTKSPTHNASECSYTHTQRTYTHTHVWVAFTMENYRFYEWLCHAEASAFVAVFAAASPRVCACLLACWSNLWMSHQWHNAPIFQCKCCEQKTSTEPAPSKHEQLSQALGWLKTNVVHFIVVIAVWGAEAIQQLQWARKEDDDDVDDDSSKAAA